MTIPRSHRPGSDRGFLNPVCETVIWSLTFRVENVFEKKNEKNPVCETVVWSLVDWVKNLNKKNDPVCHTVIWSLAFKNKALNSE